MILVEIINLNSYDWVGTAKNNRKKFNLGKSKIIEGDNEYFQWLYLLLYYLAQYKIKKKKDI